MGFSCGLTRLFCQTRIASYENIISCHLLIVIGLATVAFASPEAELKALEQQWSDAYVKGDTAALKAIEADDCMTVEPDGTVIGARREDIKGG